MTETEKDAVPTLSTAKFATKENEDLRKQDQPITKRFAPGENEYLDERQEK